MKLSTVVAILVLALPLAGFSGEPVCTSDFRIKGPNEIYLEGDVSSVMTESVKALLTEAREKHASLVRIDINSSGGSVDAAYEILRLFKKFGIPVYCRVDGEAMSAAFLILQGCAHRTATTLSMLMLHEPHITLMAAADQYRFLELSESLRVLNDSMVRVYASRMLVTSAYIAERIKRQDWYLTPEEALAVGAIDEIEPNQLDLDPLQIDVPRTLRFEIPLVP